MEIPETLTEAQNRHRILAGGLARGGTQSNARMVPYKERYAFHNGVAETPAQYLQKAGDDEAKRQKRRRQ